MSSYDINDLIGKKVRIAKEDTSDAVFIVWGILGREGISYVVRTDDAYVCFVKYKNISKIYLIDKEHFTIFI